MIGQKNRMLKSILIVSIIFLIPPAACANDYEVEYKNASAQIINMLIDLEKHKCEVKSQDNNDKDSDNFTLDCSERASFIASNKQIYFDLMDVYNIIQNDTRNIWADDSHLVMALFYLTVAMPMNEFGPIAWEKIDSLFSNYSHFKIEDWTIENFKKYGSFKFFFDKNSWGAKVPPEMEVLLKQDDFISLLMLSELNLLVLYDRKEEAESLLERRKSFIKPEVKK